MGFRRTSCALIWAISIVAALTQSAAMADFVAFNGSDVAPNIAEIHVAEDGVRVQLEVFVGDLDIFDALVPDNWFKSEASTRAAPAERLADFAENGISIRRSDGTTLPVSIEIVERRKRIDRASPMAGKSDPATGKIVPAPPEDPRVLYAELFYSFNGDRPDTLVFIPPLDEEGISRVSIGMVVYDHEVPVIEFRYLTKEATLNIDWMDPWYSQFTNMNLWRRNRFPMTSFLYVEPYEVRHEALIRVRDAVELVGLELQGQWLTKMESEQLIELAASKIGTHTPITLDGQTVTPTFERAAFLNIGMRGLVILGDNERVNVDAAMLGLAWSVPTDGYPQKAQLEWTIFNENGMDVPVHSIDAAGPFLSQLKPDDPVLYWTNHFKTYEPPIVAPVAYGTERTLDVPVITILLTVFTFGTVVLLFRRRTNPGTLRISALVALIVVTGTSTQIGWVTVENPMAGTPDDATVTRISGQLIENFHSALQEKIPGRVNVAVLTSVTPEAFEDVKLELERALVIEMQGGGVGTVKGIRDLSVTNVRSISGEGGFQAAVSWSVTAFGDHWGHPHQKNIRFGALMDIAPIDGAWKITGMTVTSAQPEV